VIKRRPVASAAKTGDILLSGEQKVRYGDLAEPNAVIAPQPGAVPRYERPDLDPSSITEKFAQRQFSYSLEKLGIGTA
jgi:hypothetical protein